MANNECPSLPLLWRLQLVTMTVAAIVAAMLIVTWSCSSYFLSFRDVPGQEFLLGMLFIVLMGSFAAQILPSTAIGDAWLLLLLLAILYSVAVIRASVQIFQRVNLPDCDTYQLRVAVIMSWVIPLLGVKCSRIQSNAPSNQVEPEDPTLNMVNVDGDLNGLGRSHATAPAASLATVDAAGNQYSADKIADSSALTMNAHALPSYREVMTSTADSDSCA
eukprot:TRINITY_DN5719_c0_g1_i1.p1 TRINITY_DN5719_c0_g1~~TRINITY_DN5719_c0_g1_i1.p1  ORF type:complete len:219 (+),score=24.55 TRINITY_DN5719_c0_g1_i1:88-744(+)